MVNLMSVDCETINGLMGKSQIHPFSLFKIMCLVRSSNFEQLSFREYLRLKSFHKCFMVFAFSNWYGHVFFVARTWNFDTGRIRIHDFPSDATEHSHWSENTWLESATNETKRRKNKFDKWSTFGCEAYQIIWMGGTLSKANFRFYHFRSFLTCFRLTLSNLFLNKNLRYSRERTSINENDGFRKFG